MAKTQRSLHQPRSYRLRLQDVRAYGETLSTWFSAGLVNMCSKVSLVVLETKNSPPYGPQYPPMWATDIGVIPKSTENLWSLKSRSSRGPTAKNHVDAD